MVWPNGRKTWVQRLTIDGRRTDLGLGPYPAVSLAQARQKALDNRSLTKTGGNPLAVKHEEAMLSQLPTFESLARQHIAENSGSWRNAKHRAQWLSSLATYAFPTLGSLRVNEITRRHVIDALTSHLDHQAGDRAAGTAAHPLHHGPGRCHGVRRLQPGWGRHQRRACQAAPRQGPPPCPALQGPARSPPDGPGVHRQARR